MTWHAWTGAPAPLFEIELEACNPLDLPELTHRYGVLAILIDDDGRSWPIYRYQGTRARLRRFLEECYEDGSGDPFDERFTLRPAQSPTTNGER